jgi:hypothetical protein
MRRYKGHGLIFIGLLFICFFYFLPVILSFINPPLQLFIDYIEYGQEKFGLENKSIGIFLWTFWLPLLFAVYYYWKMYLESVKKKYTDKR